MHSQRVYKAGERHGLRPWMLGIRDRGSGFRFPDKGGPFVRGFLAICSGKITWICRRRRGLCSACDQLGRMHGVDPCRRTGSNPQPWPRVAYL